MITTIIQIASVFTAITVIATFFIKIYKFVKKIDSNLNENTLSTLRLVINDENMPLDERINAGEKYVSMGGNGSIHVKYDYLKEQYKKELQEKEV